MLPGILFGLALLAAAAASWFVLPRRPKVWQRLPREKVIGLILGGISLFWATRLVSTLLEGPLAWLGIVIWPVAVFVTISAYFVLEYLFTRALGGFLLLTVHWLMHLAFVHHAPWRPLFAIVCYLLGLAGIWIIAHPWRFRNFLRGICESPRFRHGAVAWLGASGLVTLAISLATYL